MKIINDNGILTTRYRSEQGGCFRVPHGFQFVMRNTVLKTPSVAFFPSMRQPRGSYHKRRREVGVSQQFAASLIEIIDIAVLKIDLANPRYPGDLSGRARWSTSMYQCPSCGHVSPPASINNVVIDRSRDAPCCSSPPQTRTCGVTASGSHLGSKGKYGGVGGTVGVNPPPTREIGCSVCAGVETLYAQDRGQVMCDKLQNKEGYC
jgi:hypothetical protein